jgi:hypothetical protein
MGNVMPGSDLAFFSTILPALAAWFAVMGYLLLR